LDRHLRRHRAHRRRPHRRRDAGGRPPRRRRRRGLGPPGSSERVSDRVSERAAAPSGRELTGWGGSLRLQAIIGTALAAVSTVVALAAGGYFWARWAWFVVGLALAGQVAVREALRKPGVRGIAFAVHAR